jgi:O-antigen/teichoic acid export membrane protein
LLDVPPAASDAPARVDETGVELKRGAFLNTIAMLASNFRGIFSFLVARLLGPAALGIFSVAWSTTDIISKIGVLGLDNAITTFIARSEAVGNRARAGSFSSRCSTGGRAVDCDRCHRHSSAPVF